MKDSIGRTIRVGDWGVGPFKNNLCWFNVLKIKNKVFYSSKGRWDPKKVIILNDIPIKNREPINQLLIEKFGKVIQNTDQLEIEIIDKKEESTNVNEHSSDRMRGDRIIFSPPPGQTN